MVGGQPHCGNGVSMSLDRNKPTTWASRELYVPPDFDVAAYQNRIDEVMGKSDTGLPIVRLVWAGDIKKCFSKFYTSWNSAGFGVDSELRAKYLYASIKIPGSPDIIDIPPPRWIFEEFNHPGQYMASWQAARFDSENREVRPAPPPNGYYSELFPIVTHKADECCKEAAEKKVICWGYYREPDEKDLEVLRAAKKLRDEDPFVDPTKPLDEATLARARAEALVQVEKFEKERDQKLKDFVDENAVELLELCGVPVSDVARKMFSIPTALRGMNQKTESGVIVPYK